MQNNVCLRNCNTEREIQSIDVESSGSNHQPLSPSVESSRSAFAKSTVGLVGSRSALAQTPTNHLTPGGLRVTTSLISPAANSASCSPSVGSISAPAQTPGSSSTVLVDSNSTSSTSKFATLTIFHMLSIVKVKLVIVCTYSQTCNYNCDSKYLQFVSAMLESYHYVCLFIMASGIY